MNDSEIKKLAAAIGQDTPQGRRKIKASLAKLKAAVDAGRVEMRDDGSMSVADVLREFPGHVPPLPVGFIRAKNLRDKLQECAALETTGHKSFAGIQRQELSIVCTAAGMLLSSLLCRVAVDQPEVGTALLADMEQALRHDIKDTIALYENFKKARK